MIISNKLPSDISRAYNTQSARVEDRSAAGAATSGKQQRDEVSLSSEAHILQKAKSAAMDAPDVRAGRVAELKRQIAEGTYEIPVDDLVNRLLGGADSVTAEE